MLSPLMRRFSHRFRTPKSVHDGQRQPERKELSMEELEERILEEARRYEYDLRKLAKT